MLAAKGGGVVGGKKPLTENNLDGALVSTAPTVGVNGGGGDEGYGDPVNINVLETTINLRNQLRTVLEARPELTVNDDESEDPSSSPLVWICKWVDYSDKYGFGYHLSDDTIGVSFNDQTKVVLLSDGKSMHYIDREGMEAYHKVDDYPDYLIKKVKLLKYFQQYMQDNLLKVI